MTHLSDPPLPEIADSLPTPLSRNRNFLSIWTGQIFSQIADKVYLVLTIALISQKLSAEESNMSPLVTGIMVSFTVPAIIFGSLAGVFVDRWSKKWVLIISNFLRGALVFAIPFLLDWFTEDKQGYLSLLSITFLVSTLTQFFTPAEQSGIALVVDRQQLLLANSAYATTVMAAMILGFAAGEPLLVFADRWLGDYGREILVGGCYLMAGIFLLGLQTGETADMRHQQEFHIWKDLQEGIAYVRTQPIVQSAMLSLLTTYSVIAALTVLAVRLADNLSLATEQFGYLLAVASLGIVGGATIVGQIGSWLPRQQWAMVGSIGVSTFLGGLALTSHYLVPALSMIAGIGISAGISVIPMQTVIQEETPEAMRGKVFGLQNNVVNVALSLPLVLVGLAESYFGLAAVLFGLSGAILIGGILSASIATSQKT